MIHVIEKQDCCGCESCYNACHLNAISMSKDEEGFLYPHVDLEKCVDCGLCERVCPVLNKNLYPGKTEAKAFAAKSIDRKLRAVSSSGGIFSAIAESVIQDAGVVFGVSMNEDQTGAVHIAVDTAEEISKLRGSKYLQSKISNTYNNVLNCLEEGKRVLFSGTPCQVAGLKFFLKKDYDNLLCVDVICHGVPSGLVWEKYIEYIKNKYRGTIKKVSFRAKTEGWMEFGQEYDIIEGRSIYIPKYEDMFLRLFLSDSCLRPSCYSCVPKDYGYMSDITLGDFWAIDRVDSKFNDGLGTSLVIVHSKKGENALQKLLDKLIIKEEPYEESIRGNSVTEQTKRPASRNVFFRDVETQTIRQLAKIYAPLSPRTKMKVFLRKAGLLSISKKLRGGGKAIADYGMQVLIATERE